MTTSNFDVHDLADTAIDNVERSVTLDVVTTPAATPAELDKLLAGGGRRRWQGAVRPYLALADFVAITLGLFFVPTPPMATMLGMYLGAALVLHGMGAYRSRLTLSALDDAPVFVLAALVGGFTELAFHTLFAGSVPSRLLYQAIAVAAALLVTRAVAYEVVRRARARGTVEHRALVVGTGTVGRHVTESMLAHPEFGLRPVGFVDAEIPADDAMLPAPFLGRHADLARLIRREGISEVIVAFGAQDTVGGAEDDTPLARIVAECERVDVELFYISRFPELHRRSRDTDELWGTALVRVRRAPWQGLAFSTKRLFDIVSAGTALLVLAPLLAMVALMVRIENGKGVLFRQTRIGLDGQPFTILKFRSIKPEALGMTDGVARFSVNGDPNIGKFSKLMRATSIDELPQLLNVLRGDMTIVGPRPERDVFVEEFSQSVPDYGRRHRMPVGLTGWAQVNGLRGNTSIADRVRFDNDYIQNWSLWFDMKIIARTVGVVALKRGS